MVTNARWEGASLFLSAPGAIRRAEIAQLAPGLPDLERLFAFMRDAELRFATLRLRLLERAWVAAGEVVRTHELLLRHPGQARVIVATESGGAAGSADVWLSDGTVVRTFRSGQRVVTSRPARGRLQGLDSDRDLPGPGRAYRPVTPVPANSLVDTFIHPAGFCQNVLATGACQVLREEPATGRTTIIFESLHPRTVDLAGDRADRRFVVAVDRETGVVAGLAEFYGDRPSRLVAATELSPDASIPDAAFTLRAPDDASHIY